MFGSRRLAKRSIIGTRVCAPWTDGRYYPGVILATQTWPNKEEVFTIQFDDGYSKTLQDKDLIGPGFQTIQHVTLKPLQRVFVTYNGREVSGIVEQHDVIEDNVFIRVDNGPAGTEDLEIDRKLEEVRLLPSRKSSRLQKQDTDYSRMADMPGSSSEAKKRTVSQIIDVPSPAAKQSRRRNDSVSPDIELMECGDEEEEEEEEEEERVGDRGGGGGGGRTEEVMDAREAAMVLTALSCSPASPGFHHHINIEKQTGGSPIGCSSHSSSGIWGMKGSSHSANSSLTPSPPQLSTSAPVRSSVLQEVSSLFGTPPIDEGIDLDETTAYFATDDIGAKKRRPSTRTVFQCTWQKCGRLYNTVNGIERHVRCEHLGPRPYDPNADDLSDDIDEEEFYYTEVEVTVDTMTQTFADMYTSSPPSSIPMFNGPAYRSPITTTDVPVASTSTAPAHEASSPPQQSVFLPDHDYQKKSIPLSIPPPSSSAHDGSSPSPSGHGSSYPGTLSINIPQLSRSLSWQANGSSGPKISKSSPSPNPKPHYSQSPGKQHSSPLHKKSRSETKKCRKIYGMENREMWCTQCKWKKACTRFMD